MARHRTTERLGSPADPSRDVEVTVVSQAPARAPVSARAAKALCAALALVVLAAVAILEDPLHGAEATHGGHRAKQPVNSAVLGVAYFTPEGNPGQDPIAAAFRGPLRCLSLTYAASNREYVRAQPASGLTCPSYPPGAMIFRWIDGNPEPILESDTYSCPVRSLPASVQAELHVCPRRGAD